MLTGLLVVKPRFVCLVMVTGSGLASTAGTKSTPSKNCRQTARDSGRSLLLASIWVASLEVQADGAPKLCARPKGLSSVGEFDLTAPVRTRWMTFLRRKPSTDL